MSRRVKVTVDFEILGVAEIAEVSGLQADTITKYRKRGIFPDPDYSTARQDLWKAETIEAWLEERAEGAKK